MLVRIKIARRQLRLTDEKIRKLIAEGQGEGAACVDRRLDLGRALDQFFHLSAHKVIPPRMEEKPCLRRLSVRSAGGSADRGA